MTVTSLKRKKLKNRFVASARINSIKQLTARPPVKKVDIEEIKATFNKQEGDANAPANKKKDTE